METLTVTPVQVVRAFREIDDYNKGRLSKLLPGATLRESSRKSGNGKVLLIVLIIMGVFVFFGTDDPMTAMVVSALLVMAILLFTVVKQISQWVGFIEVIPPDKKHEAVYAPRWQLSITKEAKKIAPQLMKDVGVRTKFCEFMGKNEDDTMKLVELLMVGMLTTALATPESVAELYAWVVILVMKKGVDKICA